MGFRDCNAVLAVVVCFADEKIATLNSDLSTAAPDARGKIESALAAQEKARKGAQDTIAKLGSDTTSLVGLEKPLFQLKNPGLISIPLGFLAVIIGSLLYRDKRADDMWDELYVRQNTGINAEGATAH